jgi:urease alpha subunit
MPSARGTPPWKGPSQSGTAATGERSATRPPALSTTFVSTAAIEGGIRKRLGSRRRFVAVAGMRSATRGSLVHNTAVLPVEVDPEDGTVTLEGRVVSVETGLGGPTKSKVSAGVIGRHLASNV